MPHGRKKPAQKTNKKKKGGNNRGPGAAGQSAETNRPIPAAPANERIEPSEAVLPQENTTTPPNPLGYESIYVRYKDATRRFKEGLRSMVPDKIFQGDYVQSLANAVDYLHDNQKTNITDSLLRDLKLAIRVRRRVAKNHHRGGDEGHSYFLSMLVYCFAVLRQLKPLVKKRRTAQATAQEEDPIENRFAALSMEQDGDDDDEADLPSERVAKPEEPQLPLRLTLDELISGSDREAAILFLMTLDEIMGLNVQQYNTLKRNWVRNNVAHQPPSGIVVDILEASTVANLGIQYVQFLEQTLIMDYPHMNTIYRLMAVLVFPELTKDLTTEVTEKSPVGASFKETDAIMFLGDCLEKTIRNGSDTTMTNLTANFCKKWGMSKEQVDSCYLKGIHVLVCMELPLAQVQAHMHSILDIVRQFGTDVEEGTWLRDYEFIGTADRSIFMTTRFLQSLSNIIHEQNFAHITRKGFFGKSWDETRTGLAKRISQDMDELLMAEILPILINVCCGSVWQELPYQDELLPLFSLLRTFVRDPKKPVSWALAFAVHTILTSIFEVQGGNHVHGIAEVAESCFNVYFEQLVSASQALKGSSQPRYWAENLKKLQILKKLVEPPTLKPSREQTLRGLWNPFCAGNFLGYVAYFSNLRQGSWMVDSFSQLRIVLHLYNALKDVGLAQPDSQGFLELLDKNFENSKAVWEGPKPTRGKFVLRWWIAFGTEVMEAKRLSNEAAARFSRVQPTSNTVSRPSRRQETARQMTPIEPEKLSKSYRRIMNRDFSDVVDKYHNTAKQKSNPQFDHLVRCNDTLDAIYEDQSYLAMNMTALGAHLNKFIDQFFSHYWKKEIQMIVQTTPDSVRFGARTDGRRVGRQSWETSDDNLGRQAMVCIMAEEILGRLDFLELSVPNPAVVHLVSFMNKYFNQLDPRLFMYFTPIEVVEEKDQL